ncbi:MAG: class I SAM-dependent methyltransferase [Candidatus Bruticola sp.]
MEENWLNEDYVRYYNKNYVTEDEYFKQCLHMLKVGADDTFIDFGCGNGDMLRLAAPLARKVFGLDISRLQIELAATNLRSFANTELTQAAFTEYFPPPNIFNKGFSRKALHHLTDQEKAVFIKNVGAAFRPGALFYIEDGIFFNFERHQLHKNWEKLKEDAAKYYGPTWPSKEHDVMNSFLNEFPCGLEYWRKCLEEAGFSIIETMPKCSFYGGIMAKKK